MKHLLFVTLVALPTLASANDLRGVYQNNRGVMQFGQKKSVKAFDQFTHALGEMPFSGEVHYNLGTAFLANQEFPKAISEFNEALRNSQGSSRRERETRFRAAFNKAVALTAEKRIDEALNSYQDALNENPESIETKTNIELLTQAAGGKGKGDDKDQDQNQKKDQKDQKGDPKDQNKDQKKDPKDGEGKDQKDQKQQPKDQQQKQKPTPKPFKSDELNQQDVGKILDELKRQEEQIRARMQNDKVKDAPNDKDW